MMSLKDENKKSRTIKTWSDYIKVHKVHRDDHYTHISINPRTQFLVPIDKMETFFGYLCDQTLPADPHPTICEKEMLVAPICGDFHVQLPIADEKYDPDNLESIIAVETIDEVLRFFFRAIDTYMKLPEGPDCNINYFTTVAVTTTPTYITADNKLAQTAFIQFPFLHTESHHHAVIRNYVTTLAKGLTFNVGPNRIEYTNCLFKREPSFAWPLYHCSDDLVRPPALDLRLTNKRFDVLSPAIFNYQENHYLREKKLSEEFFTSRSPEDLLPIYLSLSSWQMPEHTAVLKPEFTSVLDAKSSSRAKKAPAKKPVVPSLGAGKELSQEKKQVLQDYFPLLSLDRGRNEPLCKLVARTLKNITKGSYEGYALFQDFVRNAAVFSDDDAAAMWEENFLCYYGIKTILHWAKKDSPEKYHNIRKKELKNAIEQAVSGTSWENAKLLKLVYGDQFVCSSIKSHIWFEFYDHRWHQVEEAVTIYNQISEGFIKPFNAYALDLSDEIARLNEQGMNTKLLEAQRTQVQKHINNLKTRRYKMDLLRESEMIFFDEHFKDYCDENSNLTHFTNGVYDVELGILRDGSPEDYITKSAGIALDLTLTEDSPSVRELFDYMRRVFVDEAERDFVTLFCASLLKGGNLDKKCPQFIGEGNNSKTVFGILISTTFKDLVVKLPANSVTSSRPGASAATPEIQRIKGARLCIISEPADAENVNMSFLKELTGNDPMYSRGLYKEGCEFKPQAKVIVLCNELLKSHTAQTAGVGRLDWVIPFESTFVKKDYPLTEEEQFAKRIFPEDPYFIDRLPDMAGAFAWLCVNNYARYKEQGLKETPKMLELAKEYREENNIYLRFWGECVVADPTKSLTLARLMKEFKPWFNESFQGNKVPDRDVIKKAINRFLKAPMRTETWEGYAIKTYSAEDE